MINDDSDDGSLRRRRARALGRTSDWTTALAEATKAVELQPDEWEGWYQRGTAEGQLGQWDLATADLATAFELARDPDLGPGQVARWRLGAGDLPGYRHACEKLLTDHGDAKNAGVAAATAWTCVLAPGAVSDYTPVVHLAETALAGRPDDPDIMTTMGAALYRSGQLEPASKQLEAAVQARPGLAAAWFLLALTRQRQEQTDAAKASLEKGVVRMDGSAEVGTNPPPLSWRQRVEWRALRREAEDALGVKH